MTLFIKYTALLSLLLCASVSSANEQIQTSVEPVKPLETVTCEGEKGWLHCPQYEMIHINNVYWGRDDHVTCPKNPTGLTIDRLCDANKENALSKVNGQCKNEQACEIIASNIFFDDNSCGNVYKFLKVKYECIADESNAIDVLQ